MSETVPTYERWRKEMEMWMQRGEALEAIAAKHPEIPFEVGCIYNRLEWYVSGEDIQAFSSRARQVAVIFGTPDSVKTTHANGGKAPDMEATWQLDDDRKVRLWAMNPECRIQPGTNYVMSTHTDGEYPDIHPECADVLRELEDFVPEDAPCVGVPG